MNLFEQPIQWIELRKKVHTFTKLQKWYSKLSNGEFEIPINKFTETEMCWKIVGRLEDENERNFSGSWLFIWISIGLIFVR